MTSMENGIRRELVTDYLIGENFADLWPANTRPVILEFAPGVKVEQCILATRDGSDKAQFLNAAGKPCKEVEPHIYEAPHFMLLT